MRPIAIFVRRRRGLPIFLGTIHALTKGEAIHCFASQSCAYDARELCARYA